MHAPCQFYQFGLRKTTLILNLKARFTSDGDRSGDIRSCPSSRLHEFDVLSIRARTVRTIITLVIDNA